MGQRHQAHSDDELPDTADELPGLSTERSSPSKVSGLAAVQRFIVPRAAVDQVHAHLADVGRSGYEGLGLWVGHVADETANVQRALIPQQRLIRSAAGVGVYVDGTELHRLNMWLFENGLRILAQIHSHPTDAYHSDTDDENALATTVGSLSLVVPDFARGPADLLQTAVYRLNRAGKWVEIPRQAVGRLIEIVD
nr:Mov34/MPN/PAD-1 family protein [Ensifer sp. ENS07]